MNQDTTAQKGFTLIELSIVLIVIGLMIGGVLAGQSLMLSAKEKKVGTDIQKLSTAISAFQEKYAGLPGNLANATDYWPADPNCPGSSSTTQTCNGSGSGMIGGALDWYQQSSSSQYEVFHVFQQLALAHLIEGAYDSNPWANTSFMPIGVADIGGTVCMMYDGGILNSEMGGPTSTLGTHVFILAINPCRSQGTPGNIVMFTPVQAQAIDAKFDDGLPNTGNVIATQHWGDSGICRNGSGYGPATNVYAPYDSGLGIGIFAGGHGCALYWSSGF